jgi:hypothetical protein
VAGNARRAARGGLGNYSLFLTEDGLLVGYLTWTASRPTRASGGSTSYFTWTETSKIPAAWK